MLCESSLHHNHPWIEQQPIIKKNSGASSSAVASKTTSTQQYSSGTKIRTGKSFKTSASPERKSITPEKDHDVTMEEANEGVAVAAKQNGGSAAAAKGGSEGEEASSDENSYGDKDSDAMDESGSDSDAKSNKGSRKNKSNKKKAAKNNGNDSETKTTKKDNSEENNEEEPESPDDNYPLLVGTLAYSDSGDLRRHIIRGNWNYEKSQDETPQRFELIRIIPPEEKLKELPKDGEFAGSFTVQYEVKNSKGRVKMKNRAVTESGVKLTFTPKNGGDESDGMFALNGMGTNEYGVFELFGTATKNDGAGDLTYRVSVRKKYVTLSPEPKAAPAAKAKAGGNKKDKKRKHADAATADEEEKPPPTELPAEGITLRGKLVRNTSDELSLDNAAVHRVTGLWAMEGLSKILDEPDACEKFEYEHKCSGDSTIFPLSGRYTGFFYVSEAGERTKIPEKDVILKFRPNNGGYHNIEGRGSNIFGKYNITGTLAKDGTITLFRHFQALKVKAPKKPTQVKISAQANGGSSSSAKKLPTKPKVAVAAGQQASSGVLSFDDVNAPDGSEPVAPLTPPEQFTATSRGILKIENDGTHTCSGSWAMSNEHFQNGVTSKYHFGIVAHYAAEDAELMLERIKSSDLAEDDDREIKNMASDGVSPVTLAHSTFPIDSTHCKGSFKMRKGTTRTQTIVDQQIVFKYVKNSGGSYNVYGKGINEMGTFDLVGTLILQGKSNGLMQLYRIYPPAPEPGSVPPPSRNSSKVFHGSLTEKASVNSGPVPAMKPPEPFVASMSGLQRRESARVARLPSRLEEDDPQAQMDRLMDRCRQILKELHEADAQSIFASPVDPIAHGIPNYFDIIKKPMDLGTIQTKIDHNEIDSPEEFARLVRLTFENAVTYNTLPDNLVHISARNLLVLFNKKFGTTDKTFNAAKKNKKLTKAERLEVKRMEKEAAKYAKAKEKSEKERKRKADVEATNESKLMKLENVIAANKSTMTAIAQAVPKDSNANMTRTEFNLLVQAIKQVQDQIVGLHKLVKKSTMPDVAAASSSSNADSKVNFGIPSADAPSSLAAEPQSTSQPTKPKKKKHKKEVEPSPPPSPKTFPTQAPVVEDLQPLSFEEQEALSESINLLPERLLPGAMQIIREADFVNDDDDEIDLDIDQLDTKTQRKLQSFVMENVKTKKKKKPSKKAKTAQAAPAPPPPPSPSPPPPEEETKPSAKPRPPGGKSFFALDDPDDDSDDDKEEDEEDLKDDFATNWVVNPSTQDAAEEKEGGDESDKDDEDDLWGEARKEAEVSKAREADRAKREEKMRADAEIAAQKREAEAAALGEQARAKREEDEAAEVRLREEQEREAEEARKAAREKALQEVESVKTTVDIGDAQRDLMRQYEQEFNDNYSAGASPSSDFGF